MLPTLRKLWRDDAGSLIATEMSIVGSIVVMGTVTGLVAVRDAVNDELADFANAVRSLDQSYTIEGRETKGARTAGSRFVNPRPQLIAIKPVDVNVQNPFAGGSSGSSHAAD